MCVRPLAPSTLSFHPLLVVSPLNNPQSPPKEDKLHTKYVTLKWNPDPALVAPRTAVPGTNTTQPTRASHKPATHNSPPLGRMSTSPPHPPLKDPHSDENTLHRLTGLIH